MTSCLARYDRDASRYHKAVYARKRADLTAALDSTLSPLFLGQLKNLHKYCLVQFKKALIDGLKGEEYDFGDVVRKQRTKWEARFEESAKEAFVEETDWVWEDELESLKEEIGSVADQCRKDETKKMINRIEVSHLLILNRGNVDACHSGTSKNTFRNRLSYSSTRVLGTCGMKFSACLRTFL